MIPAVSCVQDAIESYRIEGGWVYAAGDGHLADPHSELYKRDRVGYLFKNGYCSIDTGKYSIAPWLAQGVANEIMDLT